MIFSLDVLPARKGDCLLLHWGTRDQPRLMIIDGGPSGVYKPHLRPRLEQVRQSRGLADDQPLAVDVMMVSHIDDDHIKGILELTAELRDRKMNGHSLPVRVRDCWHNSFNDILGDDEVRTAGAVTACFAAAGGGALVDVEGIDGDVAKILSSVGQGQTLRDDLTFLDISRNQHFGGKLIGAGATLSLHGASVKVVGPMPAELKALQKQVEKWQKARAAGQPGTAAIPAAFSDSSVTNLSSLVMLVEYGERRILLTGDARGDKILDAIEAQGLWNADGRLHVDVLKVPHHGSDNNVGPIFFEKITADHYVFSGDGEHGNPERQTLEMLLDARSQAGFTLYLTYPPAEIDKARKAEHEKQAGKPVKPGMSPLPPWSDTTDGLGALFSSRGPLMENYGQNLVIGARTIDLLPLA